MNTHGLRITTLRELHSCAKEKISVIGEATNYKPSPASFWMHRQAAAVLQAIDKGLYIYEPKEKPTWEKVKHQ